MRLVTVLLGACVLLPGGAFAQGVAPGAPCIGGGPVALDPAGGGLHLGTQSYPQTLKLCDHVVMLTFDDGPSPSTTPRVLRALRDAGVRATFFLIGRQANAHPGLARQELEEGHTVGHHSDTHPGFTLRGFDTASALADIDDGIASDERALYGAAATPDRPHTPFFRFPGFADTPDLLQQLDQRGIAVFGSDLWAGDWIAMSAEHERERVMAALDARPHHNGIILFHDTRPSTAAMLPGLLAELAEKGYRVAQPVYVKGAPPPPLTPPKTGVPLTQRIIAHLPTPIVPGSHHRDGRGGTMDRAEGVEGDAASGL